jgi:hypothetical protein
MAVTGAARQNAALILDSASHRRLRAPAALIVDVRTLVR